MFILNNQRINIHAPATINGRRYVNLLNPADREMLGVVELVEPTPPEEYSVNPEFYYKQEQDTEPFVVYTRKSDEQIAEMLMAKAKQARIQLVNDIVVTTASGKEFDGDEAAQTRMARAIVAMSDTDQTLWVLADNTPVMVTQAELKEALRMAGEEQTAIWVAPYQPTVEEPVVDPVAGE